MAIHILGIRHHGPGSARNVKQFLEQIKPDIVLVEGPPEADGILQWVTDKELVLPVAILCFQPENPQQAVFYPFAEFSPEWQAIQYARKNNIHVRFIDLPISHKFALDAAKEATTPAPADDADNTSQLNSDQDEAQQPLSPTGEEFTESIDPKNLRRDPIHELALAAGYDDGEKWWEHMVEYRKDTSAIFEAVEEMMGALREAYPNADDNMEQLREAHMRKVIRQAEKEMFGNIAVICGAWHAPALKDMPKAKEDIDLLKGLPKVKVECTWIPWTYNRLSFASGYGAGIRSPGWYEHIWHHPHDDGTRWMARVAKLFREQQMDTSVAHVMEAVRLSQSLAALRNLPKAGLEELNEATLSVLCMGENILLSLVNDQLIISDRIGNVPTEIPKPPLQLDIERLQKKLRLPATAEQKEYTLDLRKETDLQRSIFLHRLRLLKLKWGNQSSVSGKGTFKELWTLQWDPAFSIDIIEKGTWGNTVEEAAAKFVMQEAAMSDELRVVCSLLEKSIPANLPAAVEALINGINNLAATSDDVVQLMEVIPALVNVSRYGNVRNTDTTLVMGIVDSMITRICISLPAACVSVDEDAAEHLLELFRKMTEAVNLLQDEALTDQWQQTLKLIAGSSSTAPVISGYATRLLSDYRQLQGDDLVKRFYQSMSPALPPATAAAWLEGFLKGIGTILLLDEGLWSVVNSWLDQLPEDVFMQVLPLLRRTFAHFSQPERRKLGEKAKHGGTGIKSRQTITELDIERAVQGIPVVMKLFNYPIQIPQ
ncbi:DUF5682 family protein [Pseudobacter ginsenosidimutans]|uniref:Uncharacterized protein n=1 Tax=Pseudobacter ginsenosidimutans TaxID=661488 RepID=A0A4Q7MU55_9BACT|nr:DUF5682 family protein [Pseudobacter ginsenosidimutans]QEC41727.1 hypothetical protein FSB84_08480 [Pseudobacter ginsenosidimutans]RZS71469.1 hypothetical protein EV199_3372 [Pseudobacter ginsenosidimutans]